jgi:hypothetical protein
MALLATAAFSVWHVGRAGAQTMQDAYTNPGTYSLTVPPNTTSIDITAEGAEGTEGVRAVSTFAAVRFDHPCHVFNNQPSLVARR